MTSNDPPDAEETEAQSDEPTLADRVDASDDFRGALEQSTELLKEHHRILLVLVILSFVVAAAVILYPYLW